MRTPQALRGDAIPSIKSLIRQALWLRASYDNEFVELLEAIDGASQYGRKRRLPKLRYRAGRLTYLATSDRLASLAALSRRVPELYFHATIMEAVATGQLDRLVSLGTNAAQAAAQPLRASGSRATLGEVQFREVERQSYAVVLLNGVPVDRPIGASGPDTELLRFAGQGVDSRLMRSADPFIQELACLHGISELARHPEMLETAFDRDEDLAMDAIDQLQDSLSA